MGNDSMTFTPDPTPDDPKTAAMKKILDSMQRLKNRTDTQITAGATPQEIKELQGSIGRGMGGK